LNKATHFHRRPLPPDGFRLSLRSRPHYPRRARRARSVPHFLWVAFHCSPKCLCRVASHPQHLPQYPHSARARLPAQPPSAAATLRPRLPPLAATPPSHSPLTPASAPASRLLPAGAPSAAVTLARRADVLATPRGGGPSAGGAGAGPVPVAHSPSVNQLLLRQCQREAAFRLGGATPSPPISAVGCVLGHAAPSAAHPLAAIYGARAMSPSRRHSGKRTPPTSGPVAALLALGGQMRSQSARSLRSRAQRAGGLGGGALPFPPTRTYAAGEVATTPVARDAHAVIWGADAEAMQGGVVAAANVMEDDPSRMSTPGPQLSDGEYDAAEDDHDAATAVEGPASRLRPSAWGANALAAEETVAGMTAASPGPSGQSEAHIGALALARRSFEAGDVLEVSCRDARAGQSGIAMAGSSGGSGGGAAMPIAHPQGSRLAATCDVDHAAPVATPLTQDAAPGGGSGVAATGVTEMAVVPAGVVSAAMEVAGVGLDRPGSRTPQTQSPPRGTGATSSRSGAAKPSTVDRQCCRVGPFGSGHCVPRRVMRTWPPWSSRPTPRLYVCTPRPVCVGAVFLRGTRASARLVSDKITKNPNQRVISTRETLVGDTVSCAESHSALNHTRA